MSLKPIQASLLALALLGGAGLALADDPKPPAPSAKAQPTPKAKKSKASKGKLVELNGASKAELMTLPGITDALADRIIAARPYYSKAKLNVGVLPPGYYGPLHAKVMVKPPPLPKK